MGKSSNILQPRPRPRKVVSVREDSASRAKGFGGDCLDRIDVNLRLELLAAGT